MRFNRTASSLLLLSASLISLRLCAQQLGPFTQLSLVMPTGNGRIVVPAQDVMKWTLLNLYDNGTRPVLQAKSDNITISYSLFPNSTGSSAPKICRDDVVDAAIKGTTRVPELADIQQIKKFDHPPINGQSIEMGSFFVAKLMDMNLFGVAASPTVCADIHISKPSYTPSDDAAVTFLLNTFHFDPDYVPSAQDYFSLGTIFYDIFKSYGAAAAYYQRALDTIPPQASRKDRRVLVDQLSMSYGISGNLKQSRIVNEDAIKLDPDYPLYYYNLACADAEQGKASEAKLHLQQAFDRKANTIPGEELPDPTKDDSILKLKTNKEFWAFVQTLK